MLKILSSFLVLLASAPRLVAAADFSSSTPLSLGIVNPVQFPDSRFMVSGLRLSLLFSTSRGVHGLDVGGIGTITNQDFKGIQLAGAFNYNQGTATVTGLQATIGANINSGHTDIYGFQLGLANLGYLTSVYGVQMGIYNQANHVYGLQIGIVNMTNNLHGVQIGLANFNGAGPFIVSPVFNVGF